MVAGFAHYALHVTRYNFFIALNNPFCYKLPSLHAEVVELVDTLGSGSSVSIDVGVRVSPSAP